MTSSPSAASVESVGGTLQLAFVGSVVPDSPEFHTAAFNRAGQLSQQELLRGLKAAGLAPSTVLSFRLVPAFPRSRRVWVAGGWAELPGDIRVRLLPFINITLIKQITIGLAVVAALLWWAWRRRGAGPRIVYTYNLTVPPGLFTLLAARLIGARAVAALYDVGIPEHHRASDRLFRLDTTIQRRLIPRFDGHVVVTDAIMEDFAPGRSYLRVEGGLPASVVEQGAEPTPRRRSVEEPFTVVAAGSLTEVNGIPILLDAFRLIDDRHYRLRIAGRGPCQALVEEAAKNDSRIEYLGFVSFEETLALYKTADVLVNMRLTKERDTRYFFPSKTMEYLASGVPVISTCTGHVEQEFGDFCYLVPDETPEGLANAIMRVAGLSDVERSETGRRARSYMLGEKTWAVQGRKIARYLEEVAQSKR